ncbi:MAG: GAF domain-containing protein, partial [Actinomycetota bacterium]
MSPIESLPVGVNGLALAWESVAALVGALIAGLAAGTFLRARSGRRARAVAISPERERELESLRRIAAELARTSDVEGVARALLDEISSLFAVGFVALTFVSDDAREGAGFLARERGKDVDWWPSVRVDLEHEPSGIASAVRSAASFTVYDVATSTKVSSRLSKEAGAKSAAFVPLISDSGVIAVISVATTEE